MADPAPNIAEARRRIAEAIEKGLDQLDLAGLDLREVPEEVLALTNLKQLDLGLAKGSTEGAAPARNRIAALDPRLCTTLTRLQSLTLASNELTGLPADIGSLQDLEVLVLGLNKLTSLPDEIGTLQKLATLDLSNNQFASLPVAVCRCGGLVVLGLFVQPVDRVAARDRHARRAAGIAARSQSTRVASRRVRTAVGAQDSDRLRQ